MLSEINGGLMNQFIAGASCGSNPRNFAVSNNATLGGYWTYAGNYALADRYFQSAAGASSMNDMYLARGAYVFTDNAWVPNATGKECYGAASLKSYAEPTIGDLLNSCSIDWAWYGEGYAVKLTDRNATHCYPQYYDPSDNPFQYYATITDNPAHNRDYTDFAANISAGTLPAVSYIKPLGFKSEHGGGGNKISDGVTFVSGAINAILNSPAYRDSTLIILTYDESGGYYDHISTPPTSTVDGKRYAAREPVLAMGFFAMSNAVSHVQMEHASLIQFIEWNWLSGTPGQLQTRDAVVNNIGSLLDSTKTGVPVPSGNSATGIGRVKSDGDRFIPARKGFFLRNKLNQILGRLFGR